MASKFGVRVVVDRLDDLQEAIAEMAANEILVGFPEETTDRNTTGPTNAELGYIHDTGMPEQNIPARPFMMPGITEAQDKIANQLGAIAKAALVASSADQVQVGLHRVGSIAELSIKRKINSGVPPPLAESTLRDRARRGRKGAKLELAARARGEAPSTVFAKPLIDTAQMRNAVKYVIRSRKRRK